MDKQIVVCPYIEIVLSKEKMNYMVCATSWRNLFQSLFIFYLQTQLLFVFILFYYYFLNYQVYITVVQQAPSLPLGNH